MSKSQNEEARPERSGLFAQRIRASLAPLRARGVSRGLGGSRRMGGSGRMGLGGIPGPLRQRQGEPGASRAQCGLPKAARPEPGMARRFAKHRLRQNTQNGQNAFNHGPGQGGASRGDFGDRFGSHRGSSAPTKRVAQKTKRGQKRAGKTGEGQGRSGRGGNGNKPKSGRARGAQSPKKAEGEKQKSAEADFCPIRVIWRKR